MSGLFRDFLENNLVDFARTNPGVVVYVKPRRHRSAVIVAEYRRFTSRGSLHEKFKGAVHMTL